MPAYPAVPNDMFNPEFEVYRGFWMISWFIEQFAAKDKVDAAEEGVCIERYLDDKIKNIEAGSGGLIFYSRFGLRASRTRMRAAQL